MTDIEEIQKRDKAEGKQLPFQRFKLGQAYADRRALLTAHDEMKTALEFAEGALENAAYTEDGLDGDAAIAVLDMINPLIRTPEEMKARAEEIANWPVV